MTLRSARLPALCSLLSALCSLPWPVHATNYEKNRVLPNPDSEIGRITGM